MPIYDVTNKLSTLNLTSTHASSQVSYFVAKMVANQTEEKEILIFEWMICRFVELLFRDPFFGGSSYLFGAKVHFGIQEKDCKTTADLTIY